MVDILGLILAFGFIFAALGITQILLARGMVSPFVSRKLVHISVSHWWLIAMAFHDGLGFALVGPISFVVLNTISYFTQMFRSMEDTSRKKNLGTIYFPISLIVLVLATFGGPVPIYVGALSILILGYGDGLASLLGYHYGKRKINILGGEKSVLGSATMFAASFLVAVAVILHLGGGLEAWPLGLLLLAALSTALFATLVELVTPLGLDNLTVPILSMIFFWTVFV
jgi:phytol kinase